MKIKGQDMWDWMLQQKHMTDKDPEFDTELYKLCGCETLDEFARRWSKASEKPINF